MVYEAKTVLTEAERAKGYKRVELVMAGKTIRKTGRVRTYYYVDPETGERTGGTLSGSTLERSQIGRGGFEGVKYVEVPSDVEIRAKIERIEEVRERKAGERAEAEEEFKRRARGLPPLPVSKMAGLILTGLLKEKAVKEPTEREKQRQERILVTLEKQRQFATLTAAQQRTVRTLVKQGKEVSFEKGVITTTEEGRKVVITRTGAIAKVPPSAVVSPVMLEKQIAEMKRREEVKILAPPKREITPEELVRKVAEERLEEKGFIRRVATPAKEFVSRTLRGFKKSVEYAGKPIKTPQESMAIIRDPDVQTFLLVSGLTLTAGAFPAAGKVITTARRVFGAVAVKEFLEEGKPEKLGEALLLLSPEIISGISRVIPKPEIAKGVIGDVKTTLIRFRGRGVARALGVKIGGRAVFVGVGEPAPPPGIVPVLPTAIVPVPPIGIITPTAIIPSQFIPPTKIVAEKVLDITKAVTTGKKPEVVIELKEQVIPTQFDIFGKPITPPPKPPIKEPITTMIGKDIVVEIVKPKPPITLQRIEVTGAVPVFSPIADYPAKFVEVGKEIQIKLPVEEPKLVVYDPVTNRIRLLGREDIRTQGGGFLGERDVFFRENGRFVEAERFQVIREISPQAEAFRVGVRLQPAVTRIDITQQKTILDLFRKEGKKAISLKEAKKRLGKEKYEELMGRKITEKKIPKKKTRREKIIEARQALISRRPEARQTFMESLRGAVTVRPVFRRVGERFGFRPLQRVTPREVARARTAARELARARGVSLLPAMVIAPTQVSATRTGLLLGLTPTQKQLRLTEQLKLEEQKITQEQIKIEEQIKVEESIEIQEQLKIQKQEIIQKQLQIQEQLQVLEQLPVTQQLGITQQIGITTPSVTVTPPPPPLLLIPPGIPSKEKVIRFVTKPPKEKGYDVMVREGEKRSDKFRRIAKNLPRHKALRKGRDVVDNYVEATYRIKPSGKTTKVVDDPSPPDLSKFRRPVPKSRLPRDSLIEMVKHRIDTLGEKRQLSYFKEQAARKKALQQQITFIKTQKKKKKKAQLQSAIVSKKAEQISFIKSSSKKSKKKGGSSIKFL